MSPTTTGMTATASPTRSVDDGLQALARAVRRARELLSEYPATDLDGMLAFWTTFLRQQLPDVALRRMWGAVERAGRVVEEFDAALADLVRVEAELEGRAASPSPPGGPTREALQAAEAWDLSARSAAADLARLSDPLTEARRVRPVLVATLALMVQGAAGADRRCRVAQMSGAVADVLRRLGELREQALAADREVAARVRRAEGLVGHALPVSAFSWADAARFPQPRLREPSDQT